MKYKIRRRTKIRGMPPRKPNFVNFVSFCFKDFISDSWGGKADFNWFMWGLLIHVRLNIHELVTDLFHGLQGNS